MKYRIRSNGTTLIELILYIALVSIFMTGVIQFAWDIMYGRVKNQSQQTLSHALRSASYRIAYEIRNASDLTSLSSQSITLASSVSSRNPTIISQSGSSIMIGFGNSGSCPVSNPCPLTSNLITITSLQFTNVSNSNVKAVRVEIGGKTSDSRQEFFAEDSVITTSQIRTSL